MDHRQTHERARAERPSTQQTDRDEHRLSRGTSRTASRATSRAQSRAQSSAQGSVQSSAAHGSVHGSVHSGAHSNASVHAADRAAAAEHPTPQKASKRESEISTISSSSSTNGRHHKTNVGPWRLGRTLGRGSSGRVRLAKHSSTGKLAAVKIVPKAAADAKKASGKKGRDAAGLPYGIEREVIIMKLIEHPNVMGLYDVWENRGELYLVLEYVEGGELFDYLIKKGRLDEKEAVHYFRQIIWGVDYCHQFNICHRDLKPENLLLDKHHNIKIADFGMAALEASDKLLETSCGSPHYASPEIVAGKNYHGSSSDIWSCGVILFALLTGHLPFDDDNIRDLLMKVQAGRFQMPPELSFHAKDLIWRILKTNPEERITTTQILDHPLLQKYPPEVAPDLAALASRRDSPIESIEDIDMEIVKNLQTLWHGEKRESMVRKLLSDESCQEKTFYHLLMKYRHDHLDDHPDDAATVPTMKKTLSSSQLSIKST
ncbi:kinase-like domain-containing protein, partial [Dipodascopsis tothii]|uniref:kinase-like domain-containing protein n=1 Tax=Dipodascopsis tothii TaxID=44089 RepID=UPI0034CF4809